MQPSNGRSLLHRWQKAAHISSQSPGKISDKIITLQRQSFFILGLLFLMLYLNHRRSDKGLKTILPLAGTAVWVTFLLPLSPPFPPFLNTFFTNNVAAWHQYMNMRTSCLKFSRLTSCNYFNLSNLPRKTWKKLIPVLILVFFNISLEILVALILKTVENRSIFIIIFTTSIGIQINILLLLSEVQWANLLPATQETTE